MDVFFNPFQERNLVLVKKRQMVRGHKCQGNNSSETKHSHHMKPVRFSNKQGAAARMKNLYRLFGLGCEL